MNPAYGARVDALIAQYNADQLALAEEFDTELRTLLMDLRPATEGPAQEIRERAKRTTEVLQHMRRVFVKHMNEELRSASPRRLTSIELHAQLVGTRE